MKQYILVDGSVAQSVNLVVGFFYTLKIKFHNGKGASAFLDVSACVLVRVIHPPSRTDWSLVDVVVHWYTLTQTRSSSLYYFATFIRSKIFSIHEFRRLIQSYNTITYCRNTSFTCIFAFYRFIDLNTLLWM